MDDYSINSLTDSKNEWCARLVSIINSTIMQGIKSIFNEAIKLCLDNNEENKYLMTFQNLLSQIPQWNPNTIEQERKRIEQVSGCKYLEELITCVHIIQLKALTCIRVGQKQKKIDIDIPSIDKFIHQVYINTARKLYTNIYLFEKDIFPLQIQKNNRELETLIKEATLITIRDNIPVEKILHAYMDETEEEEVIENTKSKFTDISNKTDLANTDLAKTDLANTDLAKTDLAKTDLANTDLVNTDLANTDLAKTDLANTDLANTNLFKTDLSIDDKLDILADNISKKADSTIQFSNTDNIIEPTGKEYLLDAPKDLDTLEKISAINKEKIAAEENQDSENIKLNIGEDIQIHMDTINISNPIELDNDPIIDDIVNL